MCPLTFHQTHLYANGNSSKYCIKHLSFDSSKKFIEELTKLTALKKFNDKIRFHSLYVSLPGGTDEPLPTLHIIISPKCFKKSLMMIKTEKANKIRDYYVDLEDICKFLSPLSNFLFIATWSLS